MVMKKIYRFSLRLTLNDKFILAQLADIDGGLSFAALIRRLIHLAAQERGLLDSHQSPVQKQIAVPGNLGGEKGCY
jgi:hypothetical protein